MANYFQRIFNTVHAESKQCTPENLAGGGDGSGNAKNIAVTADSIIAGSASGITSGSTDATSLPWYILPPPAIYPVIPSYNPSYFHTFETLVSDVKDHLHFTTKMDNVGCEGLYGLFYYVHLPDIELGIDIDIGAFVAGALSCTILGLYLDDIYYPRKIMSWWPTRWFFHFVEEAVYLSRSARWFGNAVVIGIKVIYRAGYGGVTHCISRMIYYWLRKLILRDRVLPYYPLFDDTFAALISGYMWTSYTVETEEHTSYDRIIATGWTAVFAGLVEFCLYQYFMKDPPPGLFRWLFGGAVYGPGVWRYFYVGSKPGDFY